MPRLSSWQFSGWVWTVPLQHRSVALQLMLARRQIDPAGLHAFGLAQRPKVAPGALLQTTFVICPIPPPPSIFVEPGEPADPQQSASV
jgi:hypothetical protein